MVPTSFAARSCVSPASPTSTMMNTARSSSVVVSIGRRAEKRMMPSSLTQAPTTMTMPSTSRALAKIEPMIENWATTTSPADSAKITTKNSGRLPSVDCSTPVIAGPKRSPTSSVAKETTQAIPPSAMPETTKAASRRRVGVVEHARRRPSARRARRAAAGGCGSRRAGLGAPRAPSPG